MSWPLVKLEEIFDIARGGSPRPIAQFITDAPDGLNWISIKDASNSEKYITKTKLKIRKEGLINSRLVKPGDFLLTNSMSFGRPYIMKTTGCIHDGWLVLSGDPAKVNQDYFYFLLGSDLLHKKFSSLAAGAVVKNLNINLVKGVEIPLPPLAEQQKIAAILDAADNLRQKDRQLIDHYTALSQSLFLEMFGDPVTNPMGWEIKSLIDVSNKITDGTHQSPKFISSGIPFLLVSNIIDNQISYKTKKFISEEEYEQLTKNTPIDVGDILYTSVGSYGNPAIVESGTKFCFQRHIAQIKLNHQLANARYIREMLLTDFVKKQADSLAKGVAQKTLNLKEIKSLKIMASPIALQNQFAELIQRIEQQKQQAQASLEKSEALFNSLLQRAFTGELTQHLAA
jgi:type I restriction enzyme S subunit